MEIDDVGGFGDEGTTGVANTCRWNGRRCSRSGSSALSRGMRYVLVEEMETGCWCGTWLEVLVGSNLLKTSASIGEASFFFR